MSDELGVKEIMEEAENLDESPSSNEPSGETGEVVKTQEEESKETPDTPEPEEQEAEKDVPYERFKQVNTENKTYKEELEKLKEQLEEVKSQPTELGEGDLLKFAHEKGYVLSKKEKEAQNKEDELTVQAMLENVQRPEDRKWLENFAKALRADTQREYSQKYDPIINQYQETMREIALEKDELRAKKYIQGINEKYGTSLDFEKDVDPELEKMIKDIKRQPNSQEILKNTTIYQLTRSYLADKGIELGKQLSLKEQQDLNEKKKRASMESSGVASSPKIDESNASLKELLADSMKSEGINNFI